MSAKFSGMRMRKSIKRKGYNEKTDYSDGTRNGSKQKIKECEIKNF